MSYARFGADDSDVYVYEHVSGWLECCGCRLIGDCFRTDDVRDFLEHLVAHDEDGDVVPDSTFAEIRADWAAGAFAWAAPPDQSDGKAGN